MFTVGAAFSSVGSLGPGTCRSPTALWYRCGSPLMSDHKVAWGQTTATLFFYVEGEIIFVPTLYKVCTWTSGVIIL